MTAITWLAVLYALAITAFLAVERYRSRSSRSGIDDQILSLVSGISEVDKRVDALVKLDGIRRSRIPWYMSALSTVGVAALFATSLSTATQSVKLEISQGRVEELRKEAEAFESRSKDLEGLTKELAQAALSTSESGGELTALQQRIIAARIATLTSRKELHGDTLAQAMELALAIGDQETVAQISQGNPDAWQLLGQSERVSVAEYLALTGDVQSSCAIADSILGAGTKNKRTTVRALRLRYVLRELQADVKEYASIVETSQTDASRRLQIFRSRFLRLARSTNLRCLF